MPRPGPKKQCYHPPTFTNQAKAKAGSLAQRSSLPIPNSVAFFNVVLPTGHQAVPEAPPPAHLPLAFTVDRLQTLLKTTPFVKFSSSFP